MSQGISFTSCQRAASDSNRLRATYQLLTLSHAHIFPPPPTLHATYHTLTFGQQVVHGRLQLRDAHRPLAAVHARHLLFLLVWMVGTSVGWLVSWVGGRQGASYFWLGRLDAQLCRQGAWDSIGTQRWLVSRYWVAGKQDKGTNEIQAAFRVGWLGGFNGVQRMQSALFFIITFKSSTACTNSRRRRTPAIPERPYFPRSSTASEAKAEVARCRGGTALCCSGVMCVLWYWVGMCVVVGSVRWSVQPKPASRPDSLLRPITGVDKIDATNHASHAMQSSEPVQSNQ